MAWLFNEDKALKLKFQGLSVTDVNAPSGRPVSVRFRLPEYELANVTYPLVVIDHVDVTKDSSREHRGRIQLPYAPEGQPIWWPSTATSYDPAQSPYITEFPIPFNITYQVTVTSRKIAHHMSLVQMISVFDRIPPRFGYLTIPEDGTVRTLDVSEGPHLRSYKDQDGKRSFEIAYLVSVSTELAPYQIQQFQQVHQVLVGIVDKDSQRVLDQYRANYG